MDLTCSERPQTLLEMVVWQLLGTNITVRGPVPRNKYLPSITDTLQHLITCVGLLDDNIISFLSALLIEKLVFQRQVLGHLHRGVTFLCQGLFLIHNVKDYIAVIEQLCYLNMGRTQKN